MDKTLNEIFGEVPAVWAEHILAAYLLGLADMLVKAESKHANLYFDVYKDQAEACKNGRSYAFIEGIDY